MVGPTDVDGDGTKALFEAELIDGRVVACCPGCTIGAPRFVERFMMSFPCTTRLSFDFFRSRVSISIEIYSQSFDRATFTRVSEVPSPPTSRSMTDPIRTLMTPKKP